MTEPARDFTLGQLRTFVAAARARSFSRAADQLGISQPAVSEQIAMLEGRLGHRLFIRRRGASPVLTPDGASLLERAEALLNASQGLRNERDVQRQRVRPRS